MNNAKTQDHDIPAGGQDLDDYLRSLTDDELTQTKQDIQEDILRVKLDIANAARNARASGVYSDADWFKRAHGAHSILTRQYNACCTEQGRRKKIAKSVNINTDKDKDKSTKFYKTFIRIAKEILDEATYQRILRISDEIASFTDSDSGK